MLNSREKFIRLYKSQLEFEKAYSMLESIGLASEESVFVTSFYEAFEIALEYLVTEEGKEYFFTNIMFQEDYNEFEAADLLEEYFV